METQIGKNFENIAKSIKNWWVPLVIGILLVGTGIYTFLSPLKSYLALAIIFSITFLTSGLLEVAFSIANRETIKGWGWSLTFGILTTIVGGVLLFNPELSMVTLPLYVGFVILFRSIASIGWAIDIKEFGISSWKSILFLGILGVILAMIVIWNPLAGGLTVVFWTGLAFITAGVFSIYLAFKLRKIHRFFN